MEIINRQTTPHLQHQLTAMKMVTNDNMDNAENEYPAMNEVFTRRPVRHARRNEDQFCFLFFFSKLMILNI